MAADDEINVKVTATTDEVEAGMKRAADSVNKLSDGLGKAASEAEQINPETFSGISKDLNAGILSAKEFTSSLSGIKEAANDAASGAAAVGEGARLSSSGMRELVVVAREISTGNLTRLPGSLSLLATRLNLLSPAGVLAAVGIAAVTYAIYEAITSSEQLESELATIQNSFTAIGETDRFDRSTITEYITALRQIPGVDREAGASITNEFARASANGGDMMRQLIGAVQPFAELIGKTVPEAAKVMAEAFDDPVKGLSLLKSAHVEVSAAEDDQIKEMMAVNNVAGAQKVLFDALSESLAHVVDNTTGLSRFWNDLRLSISGVNAEAAKARQQLDELAAQGVNGLGLLSAVQGLASRKLTSGGGNATASDIGIQTEAQRARAAQEANQVALNKATMDGLDIAQKTNAPLIEQQKHVEEITRLQNDLNAAITLSKDGLTDADKATGAEAAQKIQAAIDQKNKEYSDRLARQQPKINTPEPDDTDEKFTSMIDSLSAQAERNQAQYNQAVVDGEAKAADARLQSERDVVEGKRALGQLSAEDAIKKLLDLADQEHAINLRRIADMQAAAGAAGDDAGVVKARTAQITETERYTQQIVRLNEQAAQQTQQAWQKGLTPINQGFQNTLDSMLRGTQTFTTSVEKLAQNIVTSFANYTLQMGLQWVEGEARKTLATEAGNAARTASTQGATTEGLAIEGAANKESVVGNAWSAAAAVYNNVAQIPYVGWVLAPAAAATAAAAVLAFGGSIPSAAGGWVVPNDTMAMVHENEMILPAHLSQGIAGMIAGGQGGGSSGHTFNNTFHVNAGDGITAKQLPDMIVKTMTKAMRNGQFGGMTAGR